MGQSPGLPTAGQPGPMKVGEFESASVPNLTTFRFQDTAPPSPLYVQRDDQLTFQSITNQAGETITFNIRLLRVDTPQTIAPGQPGAAARQGGGPVVGTIVSLQEVHRPASTGSLTVTTRSLTEGYLLAVTANATTANNRGQTGVRVAINRGGGTGSNGWQALLSDYVYSSAAAGWPGGRNLSLVEGPGWIRLRTVANPAAGVDWTFTPAVTERVRVQSLSARLVTSAAVANRNPQIRVINSGSVVWLSSAAASQTAGTTFTYSATGLNASAQVVTTLLNIAMPPGIILSGSDIDTIGVVTQNIDVADQWSNIALSVEQWIEQL